ncbi:acyltransferase family protein [Lichenibacterium dinghuense]|uniref:acyltransferase family protein n=1 Tax=Lichenibacterium dinghuense TaxID=2895977 RepID=UPI001F2F793F|nr:acyltransferase family protein [Lichenibacterium sp. 6Y81]
MTDTAREAAATPHRPGEGRGGFYRPDIDGLRAVAVSVVVLFHYGLAGLPGGFVGVDVFFVISGYLITAITRGELARGRFSLAGFYERRVRRIVPAFALVLLATALASPFVFLPEDLRLLGKSTEASALFGSNILFARLAADYFDADNLVLQPLLHTWSLAVEGQFYLLYPLLLLPLARRPRLTAAALAILAAASFADGSWDAVHRPVSAFYLLPGRAWELLAGGLLTLLPARAVRGRAADAAVLLGLAAIGAAAALYTAATPFPGPAALLPCLGAALAIVGGGPGGRVSALLGSAPLAWLGRISYSLYLWHWPVIVLARYGGGPDLRIATRLLLLAATVALAGLSYALVERPFIAKRALPRRRGLLLAAAGATAASLALGQALDLAGRGLLPLGRLPPAVATLAAGHFDRLEGECPVPAAGAAPLPYPCRFGAAGVEPAVALWGNSYARMWVPALGADARARGTAGVALIFSKCPPLAGLDTPSLPGCARFDRDAVAYLTTHPAIRSVVLGSDWFVQSPTDLAHLDGTLAALDAAGLHVSILLAPPQADYSVPRTLALAALHGTAPPPLLTVEEARRRQSASTALIEAAAARHGATVIDPAARLCEGGTCPVARDGRPLFYDAGHITVFAAEGIRGLFAPVFPPASEPSR